MSPRRVDAAEQASYSHVFRHMVELPAEPKILSEVLDSKSRVLDVGTGATGRTAKLIESFDVAFVVSVDINLAAISEFAASGESPDIGLVAADLAALPFDDDAFDVVLIAFHGMDYLLDRVARGDALSEVARVLRPGGTFIVNAWNRLGILFSPYGWKSLQSLKVRARYVLNGDIFRPTLTDSNGLRLHQSTPRSAVKEVESQTEMRLRYVMDGHAKSRNQMLVTLISMEPYLVFDLPIA